MTCIAAATALLSLQVYICVDLDECTVQWGVAEKHASSANPPCTNINFEKGLSERAAVCAKRASPPYQRAQTHKQSYSERAHVQLMLQQVSDKKEGEQIICLHN